MSSATTPARNALGLDKSHVNDAVAITGTDRLAEPVHNHAVIIQVRSKSALSTSRSPERAVKKRTGRRKENQRTRRLSQDFTSATRCMRQGTSDTLRGLPGRMPISAMRTANT